LNYGVQRSEGGGMATRAITMLPCITGGWKEIGGGLQMSLSGAFELNGDALKRPDLMKSALGRDARVINMVELGRVLNAQNDPPVKALFVYNSNPAAVCPNHNEVVRGLRRPDLFTVVHEQFLTDTTDYADIVLPATTFFEHEDLQTAYGHYYVQLSKQAIAPLGECRSNVELFRALAERMEFGEDCWRESVDEMIDAALDSKNSWLAGISRERLESEPHVRLNFGNAASGSRDEPGRKVQIARGEGADLRSAGQPGASPELAEGAAVRTQTEKSHPPFLPFAQGNFRTPSGKAELYSEALKAEGLDPVVEFTPPSESRHGRHRATFPLELLARKADNFLNSTFSNLPSVQQMEEPGLLEMHAADARARSIVEGDSVRVFNQRGQVLLKARVDGAVQPGVVSARLNWVKLTPGFDSINSLTSEKLTDMGNSATFYSVLVEVELATPSQ
jgi:anaerobic selenocysteine-containing dehydrogenase